MMTMQVSQEQILECVYENIEDLAVPLASIISKSGWDDTVVTVLIKHPPFLEELAEILVEKRLANRMINFLSIIPEED